MDLITHPLSHRSKGPPMRQNINETWRAALAAAAVCLAGTATAAVTEFSGRLNDPANVALIGSGAEPSSPSFLDDLAVANNVGVYALQVPAAGAVRFQSVGFAAGGLDPYFSLFSGTGPVATFLSSNFSQAFSTGGDFYLSFNLPVGQYVIAVGAFANTSLAENRGNGVLGDGFVGLGQQGSLDDGFYDVLVTTPAIPEPSTALLMLAGLLFALKSRKTRLAGRSRARNLVPTTRSNDLLE